MLRRISRFKFGNFAKFGFKSAKTIVLFIIVFVAIISGSIVSGQVGRLPPLAPLKTVSIPEPDNLGDFIKDKTAAIKLGKSLFWDMQVGSDGILACASCHFHAGADNRSKNQIAPGLLRVNDDRSPNPDQTFQLGNAPNYQLKATDFPFHKLSNPNDASSVVLSDTNDVASSQGVFNTEFVDVVPGKAEDKVNQKDDPVFNVAVKEVRRVEPRNTPTVIDAVFNFRNFWDGRAQNIFNGVSPWGLRDPNAFVGKADNPSKLELVKVSLKNSSLASQAVGPPLSSFEMSADGRTFEEIGDKFGQIDRRTHSTGKGRKLPRKIGKKLLPLRPLGKQVVHLEDSVLGGDSRYPNPGLKSRSYQQLIEAAFKPQWWKSNRMVQINSDGSRTVVKKPDRSLATNEYTLMEYNFPLFFGLSIQMYESTLVSNDTPLDQFLTGDTTALTEQQQRGKDLFERRAGCIACHNGAELTNASVNSINKQRIASFQVPNGPLVVFDQGFFNIDVRPVLEDQGLSGKDPFGNSLSEAKLAQEGKSSQLLGETLTLPAGGVLNTDNNTFKTPGLRNVELTAPYFHNGGQLTLRQVVEFYNRGGDFRRPGSILPPLGLSDTQMDDLVEFMKALTDKRVRSEKAPFDHPQLFITNGHPGNTTSVTDDGTGKATDGNLLEIPAVGRDGGSGTKNFLEP